MKFSTIDLLKDIGTRKVINHELKPAYVWLTQARNLTPALSASAAICDHMHNWLLGTPHGEWVSMGVSSDGSYDIPEGLTFSFPVTCQDGEWHIVQVHNSCEPLHYPIF